MTQQLSHLFSSGIKRFFSGIFLSRVTGLGRDLVMAYMFGDHPTIAAFMVAFRFSHLFRRFFGEGPLQSAFIPQFEELRAKNLNEAAHFFRHLTFLLIALLIVIVMGIYQGLSLWAAKGALSSSMQEILILTKQLMPCLLFICLYGLNIAFLQCHHIFFLPSASPALCNGMWIVGALLMKGRPTEEGVFLLTYWIVAGFILQWVVTVPFVYQKMKSSVRSELTFSWKIHPEVKRLARSFSLGALGVGAMQLNAFFDALFAHFADERGPVYLWYSIRFYQLALAIFGIAAVSTLVPLLSRKIKEKALTEAKSIYAFGFRRVFTLMLSCTSAILVLGYAATDLIYGRGNFSPYAVNQTAYCLGAYGLGLLPATLVMLESALFYAEGNFKTPTYVALISVGTHLLLNVCFVFVLHLGAISTALATSLSSWLNFLILRRILAYKGWQTGYHSYDFFRLGSGLFVSSFLSLGVYELISFSSHFFFRLRQFVSFFLPAVAFVLGLFLYAVLMRHPDLMSVFRTFFARNHRSSQADGAIVKND